MTARVVVFFKLRDTRFGRFFRNELFSKNSNKMCNDMLS